MKIFNARFGAWALLWPLLGWPFVPVLSAQTFTNVTATVGLPQVGQMSVSWADYDNDGRLDLLAGAGVWRNTGSGFANVTASVAPGLPGANGGSAWADFDGDGRPDLFITGSRIGTNGYYISVSELWRNTGNGFTNVTASVVPGLTPGDLAWGDYDNDGRLDFLRTGGFISQIWRNTGSNFVNVTDTVAPGLTGVSGGSVAWGDYDNDGRLDFILTGGIPRRSDLDDNYPYYTPISQIWRNTGSGFVNVTATIAPGLPGAYWSSVAWGDYDNDGRLDLLLTGTGSGSQLWRNTANGFVNVTATVAPGLLAVFRGPAAWGDYDSDGRLDILLSGYLYRNTGSGFTKATVTDAPGLSQVVSSFLAWGDYDSDGRLDFLLSGSTHNTCDVCDPAPTVFQLWKNNIAQTSPPPAVITEPPASVTENSVALNAHINPRGQASTAWFIWGNNTNYGNVTAPQPMGNSNAFTSFSQEITGLSTGETYYYRAVGSNDQGEVFVGFEQRFSLATPFVATLAGGSMNPNAATFNGQANPNNLPAYGWFEWGLTPDYGQVTPVQFLGSGLNAGFGENVFGLEGNTTYYFRAVASNSLGVAYGAARSLVTPSMNVCAGSLSPTSKSLGYQGAGSSVYVLLQCNWIAINTNSWITITSATNGPAWGSQLYYTIAMNNDPQPRSGNITIGGRNFLVTQGGNHVNPSGTNVSCTYYIYPADVNHGYSAATNTISVGAPTNCAWNVSNSNSWITILSGASGMGNSQVVYAVEAHTGISRSGNVTIGGRNYAVTQAGRSVSSPADQIVALGGTATFSATAYVTPPFTYQWQFNGVNLVDGGGVSGATTSTLVLAGVQYSQGGNYRVVVSSSSGTAISLSALLTVALSSNALPFAEALDTGNMFFWKTWSDSPGNWFGQTNTTHDGIDALECSGLAPGAYASLEAKSGPGILSFWWKAAFAAPSDSLLFWMGSSQSAALTNTTDWEQRTFTVPGDVNLRWTFSNASAGEQSKAWLDQVQFTPCDFNLSSSGNSVNALGATGNVTLTSAAYCPWRVVNTNSWITILSSVANSGNGSVNYAVAANPAAVSRSGYIIIADQIFSIYQYAGSSNNAGISLTEALDTAGSLDWSTIGTPEWFGQTIVSRDGADAAQSGPIGHSAAVTAITTVNGPGTVFFWWTVSSETNKDYLKFFINGVQQTRISGEVDWQLASHNLFSGTNVLKWTYSKNSSGTAGQDRGWLDQVQFVPIPETGLCAVAVSPLGATLSASPQSGSVSVVVAAGCAWDVVNTNSWITCIASPGFVHYTVSTNSSRNQRTGVIVIGGQPFAVTQLNGLPPCSYSLSSTGFAQPNYASLGYFFVTAPTGCAWTVSNTNTWVTITSGFSGSGNGTVNYSVAQHNSPVARSGQIYVGDRSFTVSQPGAPMTLAEALDTIGTPLVWHPGYDNLWTGQGNVTHDGVDAAQTGGMPHNGYSRLQTAVTGPGILNFWWKVSSETNYDTLRFYLNGVELERISGEVDWQQRTVTLPAGVHTIQWYYFKDSSLTAGQDRGWVDQVQFVPAAGTLVISPSNAVHGSSSSTGMVSVAAALDFTWSVLNTNLWISIVSGTNGTGNGTVNYIVAANSAPPVRSGYIQIGDKNFLVIQSGYTNHNPATNCTITVLPASRTHGNGGATNTVMVTTQNGCPWSVVNTNPWISILSGLNNSNSGTVIYSLAPNTNSQTRTGNIHIGGQPFLLTQTGASLPGTNAARLRFMSRTQTNTTFFVQGEAGRMYVVESSEDLINWMRISTNSAPSTVTDAAVNVPRRFYRTMQIP